MLFSYETIFHYFRMCHFIYIWFKGYKKQKYKRATGYTLELNHPRFFSRFSYAKPLIVTKKSILLNIKEITLSI